MEIFEEETDIVNIVKTLRKVKKMLELDDQTIDREKLNIVEDENDAVFVNQCVFHVIQQAVFLVPCSLKDSWCSLRTVGVVACTLVSHPSDPGSIPTVTNVENPFLLIVLG